MEEVNKISNDRVMKISAASGVDPVRVRDICTADWPDLEKDHQQWLDDASIEEIARWVAFIARKEDEAND